MIKERARLRIIGAGLVGNVLEWYDFTVYGFFVVTIGKLFFPASDDATSLLASFGAFAVSFLMRPVGAILFGHIGDLYGRKKVLTLSVTMMAIPTFLIGLLPTYEDIGIAAPIFLVLLRMLQGISVGGEYTGSSVFLTEHAPKEKRGLYSSWCLVGSMTGILGGSAIGALTAQHTTDGELLSWGWRIPFLFGILVALTGLIVRRGIEEDTVQTDKHRSPIAEAVRNNLRELLQSTGINFTNAIGFYIVFIYVSTWLVSDEGMNNVAALNLNTISMGVAILVMPLIGYGSDRFGRKPFLLIGTGGLALFGYPLLLLMNHENTTVVLLGQIGLALFLACVLSIIQVTLSELFPRNVRVSATSLSYNIPYAIFGGTAPMVATWLIEETGNIMAFGWYMVAAALIGFLVTLRLKETNQVDLG